MAGDDPGRRRSSAPLLAAKSDVARCERIRSNMHVNDQARIMHQLTLCRLWPGLMTPGQRMTSGAR
jgi:hypothetical protein